MATRFGGKWVFGIGIFSTALLSIVTPIAAKTSVNLLIVIRAVAGLFEVNTRLYCKGLALEIRPILLMLIKIYESWQKSKFFIADRLCVFHGTGCCNSYGEQ